MWLYNVLRAVTTLWVMAPLHFTTLAVCDGHFYRVFSLFSRIFSVCVWTKFDRTQWIFFLNFNFFVIYTLVSVVAVYENTKTNTYISIRIHSFRFQCLFKLMEKETSKKKKNKKCLIRFRSIDKNLNYFYFRWFLMKLLSAFSYGTFQSIKI